MICQNKYRYHIYRAVVGFLLPLSGEVLGLSRLPLLFTVPVLSSLHSSLAIVSRRASFFLSIERLFEKERRIPSVQKAMATKNAMRIPQMATNTYSKSVDGVSTPYICVISYSRSLAFESNHFFNEYPLSKDSKSP